MQKPQTPLRYYIDREQDQAVVRTVAVPRVSSPATHCVEPAPVQAPSLRTEEAETTRRRARMGKLVQQAIRRRHR